MAEHLGRGEAAEASARRQRQIAGEPEQQAGRVQVPGAGGVDHGCDRRRRDPVRVVAGHQHRAVGAAGERRDLHLAAHHVHGLIELVGAVEAADLDLVGDENVDVAGDQVGELGAPAVDAERVGQGERHAAAVAVGDLGRLQTGALGTRPVPEVALEVDDTGRGDLRRVDVGGPQLDAGAEVGRHGPLGIFGDEHQATGGRRPLPQRRRPEVDAGGADVVAEHRAELVVLDLAHVGRLGAERGERRHGVGARAPGHLDRRPHAIVELDHARPLDQVHGALDQTEALERALVGLGDDVDDGVAETEDVIGVGRQVGHPEASVRGRETDGPPAPGSCYPIVPERQKTAS